MNKPKLLVSVTPALCQLMTSGYIARIKHRERKAEGETEVAAADRSNVLIIM